MIQEDCSNTICSIPLRSMSIGTSEALQVQSGLVMHGVSHGVAVCLSKNHRSCVSYICGGISGQQDTYLHRQSLVRT
jgi:hypothetical protein